MSTEKDQLLQWLDEATWVSQMGIGDELESLTREVGRLESNLNDLRKRVERKIRQIKDIRIQVLKLLDPEPEDMVHA